MNDLNTLALTLYGESRGEPIEGIIAVGCVIRNRVNTDLNHDNKPDWWGEGYEGVCLAKLQFSCWNKFDPNYPLLMNLQDKLEDNIDITDKFFKECNWVAQGIISEDILDITQGATQYLTLALFNSKHKPDWAKNAQLEVVKGNQVFLNI